MGISWVAATRLMSVAIVPVLYSVILGNDGMWARLRQKGELAKMLFLTLAVYALYFWVTF